jgi:hypothetical protein
VRNCPPIHDHPNLLVFRLTCGSPPSLTVLEECADASPLLPGVLADKFHIANQIEVKTSHVISQCLILPAPVTYRLRGRAREGFVEWQARGGSHTRRRFAVLLLRRFHAIRTECGPRASRFPRSPTPSKFGLGKRGNSMDMQTHEFLLATQTGMVASAIYKLESTQWVCEHKWRDMGSYWEYADSSEPECSLQSSFISPVRLK